MDRGGSAPPCRIADADLKVCASPRLEDRMDSHQREDGLSAGRLVYDFLFEEASRTHQRTDWFLVFHAILLEAFFSARPATAGVSIVAGVGVVTSYLWLMTGIRQRWLMMHLGKCVGNPQLTGKQLSAAYQAIFKARREGVPPIVRWASPVPVFCVVTPAAILVAWVALALTGGQLLRSSCLLLAASACIMSSVVAWRLKTGPDIAEDLVKLVEPGRGTQDNGVEADDDPLSR